jgi:hypothetical protein
MVDFVGWLIKLPGNSCLSSGRGDNAKTHAGLAMYRIVILLAILLAVISGCRTRLALPPDRVYVLESLYPFGDTEYRTYAALLLSLKDRKWTVRKLDPKNRGFEAEYCHKVSHDCMTIRGKIHADWKINFVIADKTFDDRHAVRFIDNLTRSYKKYSNLSNTLITDKIDDTVFWETIKNLKN